MILVDNYHILLCRLFIEGDDKKAENLKCIFLNENIRIVIKISVKFIPKGPINTILELIQIMARRQGNKPLSEPMIVS